MCWSRSIERFKRSLRRCLVVADRLDTEHKLDAGHPPRYQHLSPRFLRGVPPREGREISVPLLEARGIPASGCPIAVLHNEHEKGRALLAQLDNATQAFLTSGAAKDTVIITLQALVRLYVDHIWKEDYLLLPMSDKVLSENDHAKLCEQFDSIEAEFGAGKHQQLEQLSARLEHALVKDGPNE